MSHTVRFGTERGGIACSTGVRGTTKYRRFLSISVPSLGRYFVG